MEVRERERRRADAAWKGLATGIGRNGDGSKLPYDLG